MEKVQIAGILLTAAMIVYSCAQGRKPSIQTDQGLEIRAAGAGQGRDTATFAAGCFWCVEVQFQQLAGVDTVISGYTGGQVKNPSYKQVTTGRTGHAEAVNVIYDPKKITYDELLEAFFVAHDPTQLNRQGNDVGTQYRSAIFYRNETEKERAAFYIRSLNEAGAYEREIVTTLEPYRVFYIAEDSHQNYYNLNPDKGYCQYVIRPKLDKFKKVFKEKIRK